MAELIRRRPARGCVLEGPAQIPAAWDEFTGAELAPALGASRGAAEDLLELAHDLEVKLPGTRAAFLAGIVSQEKADIIAAATAVLDPAEDSGNAGLAGRELPPAQVLAADQRVTAWARQLRQAGLDGTMDELRARAYLDILLGIDSRPTGSHGSPAPAGPLAGVIPPGFAGNVNLTIPLATVLGLADRPGEMAGIGPIDPSLARDLAEAAARNPRSTWCVTVTGPITPPSSPPSPRT